VRINAARFIVRPEHSLPIADRVVYRSEAYWIVEKIEWARHIAEESSTEPTDEIEQLAGALLVEAVNDVRWQEGEYQKAVNHYTQLMRHRVANPLTAICGLTQTLMEMPDLDIETRSEMYHAIYTQCLELLHLSLEPRAISARGGRAAGNALRVTGIICTATLDPAGGRFSGPLIEYPVCGRSRSPALGPRALVAARVAANLAP